jgi:fatty acid amide hydrolase 2
MEAHISRVREVNGALNAVAADRFDAALAEADAADAVLAAGRATGPLHGVPFTVKEMISVEGMPHTFGCTTRAGRVAAEDATVVYRLRKAGAIPVAVSNIPEWGFWFETYNFIYGRTSNPYDPARTSGGSSGGEGALVGAGAVSFGLGSDLGGSVRMPAAFCGVFGHKPTAGLVPLTGHYPVYRRGPDVRAACINPYEVLGLLTRRASDLLPLLRIMAGPDDTDPNVNPSLSLGPDDDVDWRGRRVLVLRRPDIRLAGNTTPEVEDAVGRAAAAMKSRGATLEELEPGFFRDAFDLWVSALRTLEDPSLAGLLGDGRPINPVLELARTAIGKGRFTVPALMFALLQWLDPRSSVYFQKRLEDCARLLRDFHERVRDGVLLMPVHPRVAPRHRAPLLRPFDFAYTGIFNVLGVPATSAPAGLNANGLPLAIQIIGARGADALTIGAACAMERDLYAWQRPRTLS